MQMTVLKAALRGNSMMIPAALLTAAALASPAMAQDAPAADADAADAIVVTGSRISRPDLKSTVPVVAISGETFVNQGHSNIGDSLNDYPQLRSTRGQQNPNLGVGISGLNLLDLRGLGTVRTLVLVNGRRHVGADILNNAVSVDTNTIPANLVDKVDIVTGGNSAVYGSDAIAGVVNFMLKRNFEGLETNAKAGVSTPGKYGFNYNIDAVWGKNFADGRGNITLSAEYAHQNRVYASDAPWARSVEGFVGTDSILPAWLWVATAFPTAPITSTSAKRASTSTAWCQSPSPATAQTAASASATASRRERHTTAPISSSPMARWQCRPVPASAPV